jgi:hypothetical protein
MTMKLWELKRNRQKAIPTYLQNHVVWSRTVKCMWPRSQPNVISMNFLVMRVPHTWSNRRIQHLWAFGVPWSPSFVLGLPLQEVVFESNPNDHETWSIWCHVGIHVDFTSILHSLIHSPHMLVRATNERFLLASRGTFRASFASESHWLQPMLVLSVHWWPTPIRVGGLLYTPLVPQA